MRLSSTFVMLAVAPLLIGATEPVRLPPVSPWVLDYAENSCRLSRKFGTATDPSLLLLESTSPGSRTMLAIGSALNGSTLGNMVKTRFLPATDQHIEGESARSADRKKPAVLWASAPLPPKSELRERLTREAKRFVDREQRPPSSGPGVKAALRLETEAFAAKVTAIEIEARRKRPVILETGSLGRAVQMLEQCTRDQLRYWGVDPAIEEKIVRPVWAPAPYRWFEAADYPMASINANQQSIVAFRLLVDAAGRPTKCTTLSHVDAPAFQKVVCDILMGRARFQPAELADGTKVPSYYASQVHWRMQ